MNFLKNFSFLFIFFTFVFQLHAFDVDEMLDGDGLSSGFTHFLRIGIKTDVSSFSIEGDAQIFDKKERTVGEIQGQVTVFASQGGIKIGSRIFKEEMLKFTSELIPLKFEGKMFRGEIEVYLKNSKLIVVNKLDIEDYVKGVINKEAIPSWPVEAKKTQAVLARTFAVYQKMFNPRSEFFDLAPTVLDQVYDGLGKEDVTSVEAVNATMGEVVTLGSDPAKIYFHSTCGGTISSSAEIWKKDEPHLQELHCPYCTKSSLYRWKRNIKAADIAKKLGVKSVKSISTVRGRTRVDSVVVDGKKIQVNKFRELVGFSVIWSNDFTVTKSGSNFMFSGKGAGHGVGVCQWGMAGMAAQGKNHYEILKFYLKGIEIRKMY
ncbi:SpoIID/LytB domain-containing protein [bacterium]|nr:SpoIID/LytB domain-containing protein [bacterium]